jgi:hypothetical protein
MMTFKTLSFLQIFMILVTFATIILTIVTYDVRADGDWDVYTTHLIASITFGVIGAAAIAMHSGRRALAVPSVVLACTLVPAMMHGIRLTNPYLRGEPLTSVAATKSKPETWTSEWEPLVKEASAMMVGGDGAIKIIVRPWISASLRERPRTPRPIAPLQAPLGTTRLVIQEDIDVSISTTLSGAYLGVLQADRTRIQVVPYGIKLTVPDDRGDVSSIDIANKNWSDGAIHRWQLTGTSTRLTLRLDGATLWEGPQHEPLRPVLVGDPQADGEHGGTMTLEHARVARTLAIPVP